MVIAKAPEPGRVKTRLCPPLDPSEAAAVATACLLDTLDAAASVAAARHVLVIDGAPDPWRPPDWEVVAQRGQGLGERLANAFADVAGPAVIIAMDTPQVAPASLARALDEVATPGTAVLGPTEDGGYWALGLPGDLDPVRVFDGIQMSTPETGAAQRQRLVALGYRVVDLDVLRDIDYYEDLAPVAALVPARRVGRLIADRFAPAPASPVAVPFAPALPVAVPTQTVPTQRRCP
ncbi:MAG: TIGR04282 family arsenosugar biosynthesis glycosyltransferase [Acidimicrobiales bacterium]